MVKIAVKSTKLPIEIGEHTFHVDVTEEGKDRFFKIIEGYAAKTTKSIDKFQKGTIKAETSDKQCQKALEEVLDELLGAGAFKKLFALTPDHNLISEYYVEICGAISEEFNNRGYQSLENLQRRFDAYLKG